MTESWREHVSVRHGGLMRCCLASLKHHIDTAREPPQEGDRLMCAYCDNIGGGMVFKHGAWEWANE